MVDNGGPESIAGQLAKLMVALRFRITNEWVSCMRIGISNSEVHAAQHCWEDWTRKYHPESRIEKIEFGAKENGVAIHACLELFYQGVKAERPYKECVEMAMDEMMRRRKAALDQSDAIAMEILRKSEAILVLYFAYYKEDIENWEILSTENFYAMDAEPGDDFYIPVRIDMVIYQRKGKFAGEISPVDNKSTQDRWKQNRLNLDSQMPLYLRALRQAKFPGHPKPVIRRAIMNFIRTRTMANPHPRDLFWREFVEPPEHRYDFVYRNHLKRARQIARLKQMPLADVREDPITDLHLSGYSCQFCDFSLICEVAVDGLPQETTLDANYRKSTYGYPAIEELDNGI